MDRLIMAVKREKDVKFAITPSAIVLEKSHSSVN